MLALRATWRSTQDSKKAARSVRMTKAFYPSQRVAGYLGSESLRRLYLGSLFAAANLKSTCDAGTAQPPRRTSVNVSQEGRAIFADGGAG